jgi:uncharacterized protein (TIGR02678 family)
MEELKKLLENYFILKNENKELYYAVKDSLKNYKSFITEKLGYDIMVRNDFIKLEKLPGLAEKWMGIETFKDKNEYVFFMLILMYLEDKDKEEQFLLSHIVDYISSNSLSGTIDWTEYKTRRQLVNVIKFAIELNLFVVDEEEDKDFAQNEESEALYENTGISKYVVRNFSIDIMKCRDYKELEDQSKDLIDSERGFMRRNRVYRRLLLSPVVYNEGAEDEDYAYIKKVRGIIEEDFRKNLNWSLHVHRNGALVVPADNESIKNSFPSTLGISDVVLHLNKAIAQSINKGELKKEVNDVARISEAEFMNILKEVKACKGLGWSKEYRECSLEKLYAEVIDYMESFSILRKKEDIYIYPLVAKVVGDYPEDYVVNSGEVEVVGVGGKKDGRK